MTNIAGALATMPNAQLPSFGSKLPSTGAGFAALFDQLGAHPEPRDAPSGEAGGAAEATPDDEAQHDREAPPSADASLAPLIASLAGVQQAATQPAAAAPLGSAAAQSPDSPEPAPPRPREPAARNSLAAPAPTAEAGRAADQSAHRSDAPAAAAPALSTAPSAVSSVRVAALPGPADSGRTSLQASILLAFGQNPTSAGAPGATAALAAAALTEADADVPGPGGASRPAGDLRKAAQPPAGKTDGAKAAGPRASTGLPPSTAGKAEADGSAARTSDRETRRQGPDSGAGRSAGQSHPATHAGPPQSSAPSQDSAPVPGLGSDPGPLALAGLAPSSAGAGTAAWADGLTAKLLEEASALARQPASQTAVGGAGGAQGAAKQLSFQLSSQGAQPLAVTMRLVAGQLSLVLDVRDADALASLKRIEPHLVDRLGSNDVSVASVTVRLAPAVDAQNVAQDAPRQDSNSASTNHEPNGYASSGQERRERRPASTIAAQEAAPAGQRPARARGDLVV